MMVTIVLPVRRRPVARTAPEQLLCDFTRRAAFAIRTALPADAADGGNDDLGDCLGFCRRAQAIPTCFYQLGPLGFVPKGHTRDPMKESLFLDAARIGNDDAGVALQLDHIQVPDRLDHADGGRESGRGGQTGQRLTGPWVHRPENRGYLRRYADALDDAGP